MNGPCGAGQHSIRAAIFDFDGLILDTEWPEYQSVSEVYAEHGMELVLEEWQAIVGTADHPHWSEMLADALGRPLEDVDAIVERRRERHHDLIADQELLPGVIELLDEAADLRLPTGVASSSSSDWVEGHLDRLGLLERFDVVRCRDHVERAKPAPDLYVAVVDALEARPDEAVAFEDSAHGVAAARAAGLWCVAVPNEVTRTLDFGDAHLLVASLEEVSLRDLATVGFAP